MKTPRRKNISPSGEGSGNEIRVGMISLGCPKNLVDSEMILASAGEEGLVITQSPEDADVIIVNTCGFIESAKEESIQTILEACQLKQKPAAPGRMPRKVIVTGCLGQRYGDELCKELPEVDAVVGLGEYGSIGAAIRDLASSRQSAPLLQVSDPTKACHAEVGRFRLTPSHYAYIKVSEGCDNPCTFCAIPAIRGKFRSKPIEAIVREAEELSQSGARELILISQDTTSYGTDLSGKLELPRLLEKLSDVEGVEWIRTLYVYPSFVTDPIIDAIAGLEKVVKYVDIPLQHISDAMLRKMGRRTNEAKTRDLLEKLRNRVPGVYLRTTFLVGFPGETERDFAILRDFVGQFRFERMGVFAFSPEEGTPAASFPDPVPRELCEARAEELMLLQQENAFRHNESRKGEVTRVLVDDMEGPRGRGVALARSSGEAPEIDPRIIVETGGAAGTAPPRVGDFVTVRVTGSRHYDLLAAPVQPPGEAGRSQERQGKAG